MMLGGAIFGYCSMGSETRPMNPNNTMVIEITVESTGLFMKLVKVILFIGVEEVRRCGGRVDYNTFLSFKPL